jgi:hypothetical protein
MATKTSKISKTAKPAKKPVGIRLSPEDGHFLERLPGSNSVTEGLRILIAEARHSAGRAATIEEAQARLSMAIGDASATFRYPPRSVVCEDLLRETTLLLATVMVGPPAPGIEDETARAAYEAAIVDRGFDLTDILFRHALSSRASAWSPGVVRKRLHGSRDLLVGTLTAVAKDTPPSSRSRS